MRYVTYLSSPSETDTTGRSSYKRLQILGKKKRTSRRLVSWSCLENVGQFWVPSCFKLCTAIVLQLYCTLKNKKPCLWQSLKVPGPRFELGIGQYQSLVIAIASECYEMTVLHEMYYILKYNNLRFCKVFGSICSTTEEESPWRMEVCICLRLLQVWWSISWRSEVEED